LSLAPFFPLPPFPSPVNGVSLLSYLNIWRGGPPGHRTNRPTWRMQGSQAAQSASATDCHWPIAGTARRGLWQGCAAWKQFSSV